MSDTDQKISTDSLSKMEGIKAASNQLRGTIGEELQNSDDSFSGDAAQLLKFHGTYQQDNRDLRNRKDDEGNRLGKAYSCMIRTGPPGGKLTADQFLTELDLADQYGEGTLRLTSRQALQLHSILKTDLQKTIHEITRIKLNSYAACGDVNRNVMCNPAPYRNNPVLEQMQETTDALAAHLKPRSTAYFDFWVTDPDGEKQQVAEFKPVEEPIYGESYLPRKFKIGVALPEDNHIDVLTQDLGFVAIVENDAVIGYDVYVGGGMGRTPAKKETYPALGKPMAFVVPGEACAVAEAVVKVQRDFGNREDRKVARMKYLVDNWGIEKFRDKVAEYYGKPLAPVNGALITGVDDYMGWREQGDGKLFLGINIENGRIKDEGSLRIKTGLREVLNKYKMPVRLTALQSMILCDINPADKDEISRILTQNGIKLAEDYTLTRRFAIACPALPMCGLAVTESERVMPSLLDEIEAELARQGLEGERISVHMTGCPNGCARPYTPDIGLVGRAVNKYTLFLGGNVLGTRLAFLYKDMVKFEDIVPTLAPIFAYYKEARNDDETFGDFCDRKGLDDLENRSAAAA
ncbi:NADPH-dependent assimilatory sulfite reductase hemoprotein subunit [Rubinisphaera margarita]|uniref:NADPH-dependent assimilatory sulfite reductase hemoprotein subunit n=1 Tax=Rubinisphaera margarita TaxID=2909586 RepID=UPI001EE91601|nr:NADPH-dependent assimilatory sulfite reductase hemoprotein subunit [Rubinisphaera margarita]MCG6156813.1 NADPH-dependent assimilatory sulfite reductase hemoprotein subunit [Rubinisphaera margarita]